MKVFLEGGVFFGSLGVALVSESLLDQPGGAQCFLGWVLVVAVLEALAQLCPAPREREHRHHTPSHYTRRGHEKSRSQCYQHSERRANLRANKNS